MKLTLSKVLIVGQTALYVACVITAVREHNTSAMLGWGCATALWIANVINSATIGIYKRILNVK